MYFKISNFLNKYLGVYLDPNSHFFTKFWCYFIRIAQILGLTSLVLFSFLDIIFREKIFFKEISFHVIVVGIGSMCILRIIYFYIKCYEVHSLVQKMEKHFQYKSSTSLNDITMSETISTTNKLCLLWSIMAVGSAFLPIIATISLIPFKGKQLILPAWYPFDWRKTEYYVIIIAVQGFAHLVISFSYMVPEVFFATTLINLSGQFKIIGWEMKNFFYTPLKYFGVSKEDTILFSNFFNNNDLKFGNIEGMKYEHILSIINSRRYQIILENNMKRSFRNYLKIMEIMNELSNFFSSFLIFYLGCIEFALVFIPYALIVADDNTTAVQMVIYCIASAGNGLFVFLIGQIVTTEKDKLFHKLCECPWYICKNVKIRRIFLQITTSIFKTSFIRAGDYIPITLATYAMIFRSAGSYVVVLKEMTHRK